MFTKTAILLLIAFVLQAEALPNKNKGSFPVSKITYQELDVSIIERLTRYLGEHYDVMEELLPSVATTLYKMITHNTKLNGLKLPHIGDVMACANITLNVYDLEIFMYHVFQFGLDVYDNAADLGANIADCRSNSSNVFEVIECAFKVIDNSSPDFKAFIGRTNDLVLELQNDYGELIDNIRKCEGINKSTVAAAWNVINSQWLFSLIN